MSNKAFLAALVAALASGFGITAAALYIKDHKLLSIKKERSF